MVIASGTVLALAANRGPAAGGDVVEVQLSSALYFLLPTYLVYLICHSGSGAGLVSLAGWPSTNVDCQ